MYQERKIPPLVEARAKSLGLVGEKWLDGLDDMIQAIQRQWDITVGEALYGGTHSYTAYAEGANWGHCVLKIDIPENVDSNDFVREITTLQIANGQGYSRVFTYDISKRAYVLERLGRPLKEFPYSIEEKIKIICETLKKTWHVPVIGTALPNGDDTIAWFRQFINNAWKTLNPLCLEMVRNQAMDFLQDREEHQNLDTYALIHGDAHETNILEDISLPNTFKLIDPDGMIYERAYDLGVLMREWVHEYEVDPVENGLKRCEYLHRLTGVDKAAIWQWGFLQMVSTGLVELQIGQIAMGRKMLDIAESWCDYGNN